MLSLFERKNKACSAFLDTLTHTVNTATLQEFMAGAALEHSAHTASCEDCRDALEEFLDARALLSALPSQVEISRPWFASKVMAAIAARESEVRRLATAWTVVPRLASRLACISALAILVAGTWLYRNPVSSPSGQTATEASVESIFESSLPSHQDDVFSSTVEKNQ
ncbi:MAG: anti-sigma factor family protein [Candidatus Acidiferrales bacterium]